MSTAIRPRLTGALVAFALALACGCGGGKGSVSGKVVHQGKTVRVGSVILVGQDGTAVSVAVAPDGTFRADGVTSGKVKVGVSSPRPGSGPPGRGVNAARGEPKAPAPKTAPIADPNWFPIPDKYSDPQTSGVTIDVKSGVNDVEITLP